MTPRPSLTMPARRWREVLGQLLVEGSQRPAPARDLFYFTLDARSGVVLGTSENGARVRTQGALEGRESARVGWAPLRETKRLLYDALVLPDDEPVRIIGVGHPDQKEIAALHADGLEVPLSLPHWPGIARQLLAEIAPEPDRGRTEVSRIDGEVLQDLLKVLEPLLGRGDHRSHVHTTLEGSVLAATVMDHHNLVVARVPVLVEVLTPFAASLPQPAIRMLRGLSGADEVTIYSDGEVTSFEGNGVTYYLAHEPGPARWPDVNEALERWSEEVDVSPADLQEALERCSAILSAKTISLRGVVVRIAEGVLHVAPHLPRGKQMTPLTVTTGLAETLNLYGFYPLDLLIEMVRTLSEEKMRLRFGDADDPLQITSERTSYLVMPGTPPSGLRA